MLEVYTLESDEFRAQSDERAAAPVANRAERYGYYEGMCWPDRVVIDPEILAGKPVIRGTRLAVEFILDLLAAGDSEPDIVADYPGVMDDDILACLAYASHLAHEYRASPSPFDAPARG